MNRSGKNQVLEFRQLALLEEDRSWRHAMEHGVAQQRLPDLGRQASEEGEVLRPPPTLSAMSFTGISLL